MPNAIITAIMFVGNLVMTALPIIEVVFGISGTTFFVTGALAITAGVVGMSKLMEMSIPRPDSNYARQKTVRSTTAPVKRVYGESLISGPVAFMGVGGTGNQDLWHVIALTGDKSEAITDIYLDNIIIPNADINSGNAAGGIVNGTSTIFRPIDSTTLVTVYKYIGGQTAVSQPVASEFFKWTSDHKGQGLTYIATKFSFPDNEKIAEIWNKYNPQDIKALVKGMAIYDPRKDSTSPEYDSSLGVSTHRLSDSTTWQWSDNPALCLANYVIDDQFGMGVPSSAIDWASVHSSADYSDALVSIPNSQTQKRFTCNGVLYGTDSHSQNINKILSSMNGSLVYSSGKYVMQAGQYIEPESDAILTDNDLNGPINITVANTRDDRFNTIKGTHFNPEDLHKKVAFPEVQLTDIATRDAGEVLYKEVELPMTNDVYMCQRLTYQMINRSNDQLLIEFPCNLKALRYTVGDRVKITLDKFAGSDQDSISFNQTPFVILGFNFSAEGAVTLTMLKDTQANYTDMPAGNYSQIASDGSITDGFSGVPAPTNLGSVVDGHFVRLTWDNPVPNTTFNDIIVYQSSTSNFSDSSILLRTKNDAITFSLPSSALTKYYWVRASLYDNEVAATDIIIGQTYRIRSLGTTNWVTLGATAPVSNGDTFLATASGTTSSGTGIATDESAVSAVVGPETVTTTDQVADSVEWIDVDDSNSLRPANNATVGATLGTDVYDGQAQAYAVGDLLNSNGFFRFTRTSADDNVDAPANAAAFNTAFGRAPTDGDIVVVTNTTSSPNKQAAYQYDGSTFGTISGFFAGDLIIDDTITAAAISVDDLGAINANLGTITGGTLKGGTVPDADAAPSGTESGSFFDLDGGKFVVGNATNNLLFDSSALTVTGDITANSLTVSEANITGTLTLGGGVLQDGSGNNLTTTTTLNANQVMSDVTGVLSQAQHAIPSFYRITTDDALAPSNSEFNVVAGRLPKVNDIVITTDTTVTNPVTPNRTYGWTCTVAGTASTEATWGAISDFISGDLLVDGTVTADQIAANAVTAAKINVTNLEAIQSNLGNITAGTLKGGNVPDANAAPSGSESGSFFDLTNGKFVVGDASRSLLFDGSNLTMTGDVRVKGTVEADTLIVNNSFQFVGKEFFIAAGVEAGGITADMLSSSAINLLQGSLAQSVGGSNGDFKEGTGTFTTSGGSIVLGTSGDLFDHGELGVELEANFSISWNSTTNYGVQNFTLQFQVSTDGTNYTNVGTSHSVTISTYDLSSYYPGNYYVHYSYTDITETISAGSLTNNTDYYIRALISSVPTSVTGQTPSFTFSANEGVTGVTSTGGNADTLDNLDSTAFLRSNVDDTFDANLTITGNLTVNGTTTTVNTDDLTVKDNNITLNYSTGDSSSTANNAGITIQDAVNSTTDASILWKTASDSFEFSHGANIPKTYLKATDQDAESGTWTSSTTGASWGTIKLAAGYSYTYNAGAYKQYNIPAGADTCYMSFLKWSDGGYVDVHAIQADGDLVFLGRISTGQSVENSNEGNAIEHDGQAIVKIATGLDNFSSIRITNKRGSFYFSGLAFSTQQLDSFDSGMIAAETIHSGLLSNVTNTNWDAAYSYSQVGHLPLAGGTLTGSLTVAKSGSDSLLIIEGDSGATGQGDPGINLKASGSTIAVEGFQIWYDNNVGDAHIATTYADDIAAIRFHTRTGADKSETNERFAILGNGLVNIVSGNLAMGGNAVITNDRSLFPTSIEVSGSYSGGSGDYTNITNAQLKIGSAGTSDHWRIPHLSTSATVSGVYNYQTGKDVYWGEGTDTGTYYFRGRDLVIEDGVLKIGTDTVIDASNNLTNIRNITATGVGSTPYNLYGTGPHVYLNIGDGTTQTDYAGMKFTSDDGNAQFFRAGSNYTTWGGADAFNIYNSNGDISFHPSATANVLQVKSTGISASKAFNLSADTTAVINFSANSANDKRGISFNGRTALSADYNDGYLRINDSSEFTNGVYTPLGLRADGGVDSYTGYKVIGTPVIDISRNLTAVAGTFSGNVQVPAMGIGLNAYPASVGHTAASNEGIFWHTNTEYGIYRTAGTWVHPTYQQLRISFHTGIELDGGTAYGKSGVNLIAGNFKVGGLVTIDASRNISGNTLTAGDAFRSDRSEDASGTFLFRKGATSGATRHLNLADTLTDPAAVTAAHNPTGISWGQRTDSNGYYLIGIKNYNNGYSTHTRLRLGWHTGIEIGARSDYGGVRFFTDSPFISSTEVMSVGKSDSNVRITNNLYVAGTISASGGTSTNWNSAYTYSTVGHLPLAGGTLTGTLNITSGSSSFVGVDIGSGTQTIYSLLRLNSNNGNFQAWKAGTGYTSWGGASAMNIYTSSGDLCFHPAETANVVKMTPTGIECSQILKANAGLSQDGHTLINGTDTWYRTNSNHGIYFSTYAGGVHMEDTTWVRTYNSKRLYVGGGSAEIATTGNVTAYYSDMRLKTKTADIDNALEKVNSLSGFKYVENDLAKELGYSNDKQQVGLSAQQIQAVLPEAVSLAPIDMDTDEHTGEITSKSGENYLTVDYAKLVPLLVEAIKELTQEVESLKTKLKEK